ncbi:MAG TPA: ParA family protein [Methanofastidiosum sp.]|nr:ParA family protein [Methanofastidiosum sp.]
MGKIISVANHKGGVGKTAIALVISNTLSWLQENAPDSLPEEYRQKPILIVDTDPQANTTEALGVDPAEINANILEVYQDPRIMNTTKGISVILSSRKHKNISVIPSSIRLEKLSGEINSLIDGRNRLKLALEHIKEAYSLIVIDTPPSLGVFTQNAVVASDYVIIPLTLSKHALMGVSNMLSFLLSAKQSQNGDLNVLGLLVNGFDKRYRLQVSLLDVVQKEYKDFVFKTIIPTSSRIVENIAGRRNVLRNISVDQKDVVIAFIQEMFDRMNQKSSIPLVIA